MNLTKVLDEEDRKVAIVSDYEVQLSLYNGEEEMYVDLSRDEAIELASSLLSHAVSVVDGDAKKSLAHLRSIAKDSGIFPV